MTIASILESWDVDIGMTVANNAAGTRTVKYGATRDNVLALEVVLASGTVLWTGSRSVKQSAVPKISTVTNGRKGIRYIVTTRLFGGSFWRWVAVLSSPCQGTFLFKGAWSVQPRPNHV